MSITPYPDAGGAATYPAATLTTTGTIASAGTVRLPNAATVQARNAANSGNVQALEVTAADVVKLGTTSNATAVAASTCTVDAVTSVTVTAPSIKMGKSMTGSRVEIDEYLATYYREQFYGSGGAGQTIYTGPAATNVNANGGTYTIVAAGASNYISFEALGGLIYLGATGASGVVCQDSSNQRHRLRWVGADVATTNNTQTTLATLTPSATRPTRYRITTMVEDASGNMKLWEDVIPARGQGGSAAFAGTASPIGATVIKTADAAVTTATLEYDTSTTTVRVRGTGIAATNLTWSIFWEEIL
jgi:hypothetical protein